MGIGGEGAMSILETGSVYHCIPLAYRAKYGKKKKKKQVSIRLCVCFLLQCSYCGCLAAKTKLQH